MIIFLRRPITYIRQFRRKHPIAWWAHLIGWALVLPGYAYYLSFDEVYAPDLPSKAVIFSAQVLYFYTAIFFLLPSAFGTRNLLRANVLVFAYLLAAFLVAMTYLFVVSLLSGELIFNHDKGGKWIFDIINIFPVMLPTFYVAGLLSLCYQALVTTFLVSKHNQRLTGLLAWKRIKMRELELEWLRLQLDPHVLAGLLMQLRVLIFKRKEHLWLAMNKVIGIMQYYCSRADGNKPVPLADEIVHAENLIAILRLGTKKVYSQIRVKGDISKIVIIPMLLLMLVKNQTKHGILFSKRHPAFVDIVAGASGLHIHTLNFTSGKEEENGHSTHQGLKNIQARLSHYYPGHFKFDFAKSEDGLFRVDLWLDGCPDYFS